MIRRAHLSFRSPLAQLAASIAVVACGGGGASPAEPMRVSPTMVGATPSDGAPAKNGPRLFDIVAEPAGVNCSNGGQAIVSGSDVNRNGMLDADEITNKSYVCNGVHGKTPVLAAKSVPVGTACPTGGQAISWGYDADGDGVLDASEIASTAYVCNGLNGVAGQDGANGKTTLVTLIPQAANQHCPNGGNGVYSGLDLDGDGLLHPTEVKNTSFVCNGTNGQTSLVRKEPEPAGASCANGGIRILSGVDANGDGTLADTEVTDTGFACNGAPGPVATAKIGMTAEPPGPHCASGGQRIDVGIDTNASGALDPAEIAETGYVCNGSSGASVMTIETSPPRETCPLGGTTVIIGADVNGNGVLDASEGAASVTLCRMTTASTSIACAEGELAIDEGFDTNQNGKLDAVEVAASKCTALGYRSVVSHWGGSFALAGDGSVRRWGWGLLPSVIGSIPPAKLVSAASRYRFAIVGDDGVVYQSSGDGSTVAVVEDLPSPATAVGVGDEHACALANGTVHCWGSNTYGQLGLPSTTSQSALPVAIPSLPEVKALSAGAGHTCAIAADASVWCWGSNFRGQLGRAPSTLGEPGPVAGVSGAVAVTAGGKSLYYAAGHSCALLTDGTARCWGDNRSGQLGAWASLATPSLVGLASISAGDAHTCAVLVDGRAYCWGANGSGQLGSTTYSSTFITPLQVPLTEKATSIAAGALHTCANFADGTIRCWGEGPALGVGSFDGILPPQLLPAP